MYCRQCGYELEKGAGSCPGCGAPVEEAAASASERRAVTAGLLALFLGAFGAHNFYLGNRSKAMTQLLVSTVGGVLSCFLSTFVMGMWALVEAIQIFRNGIPENP